MDKQLVAVLFGVLTLIATAAFTIAKGYGLSNRIDAVDRLQQDIRTRQITVLIELERLRQNKCANE